jgi:hypothetical protein
MRGTCAGVPIILTALLAGCASQVTTQTSYDVYFRAGVRSEFGYAGGEAGVMPVIITGNPFPLLPKAAVDQSIAAAMQGSVNGPPVRFVAVPTSAMPQGYAVVVLLNAAPGTSANLLCAQRGSLEPPPRSARTTLLMAFCGNADARSWAYSTTGPVASPDDPLFQELIVRTTFALLPRRDDDWGRGNIM